jgi:aquaporin Z
VRPLVAEAIGTFALVFAGCGAIVVDAKTGQLGHLGVALTFGLVIMVMIYAVGHVSGAHFNPAVSVGLAFGKRFPWKDLPAYVAAQVAGGIAGSGVLYVIASGAEGFSLAGGFAANGYGDHSPGHYGLVAALVTEVVLTFIFLAVILGSTHGNAPTGFAPLAIGLCLTLIHLIGIPITNLSVNPARSTGPAVYVGGWALGQLWLFWLAPIVGAAAAGIVVPGILNPPDTAKVVGAKPAT